MYTVYMYRYIMVYIYIYTTCNYVYIHIYIYYTHIYILYTYIHPQQKSVRSQHPLGCALLRSATCHASRFSKGVPTALRTTPEPQAAMVQPQTCWAREPGSMEMRWKIEDLYGIWWGFGGDMVGMSWDYHECESIFPLYRGLMWG